MLSAQSLVVPVRCNGLLRLPVRGASSYVSASCVSRQKLQNGSHDNSGDQAACLREPAPRRTRKSWTAWTFSTPGERIFRCLNLANQFTSTPAPSAISRYVNLLFAMSAYVLESRSI